MTGIDKSATFTNSVDRADTRHLCRLDCLEPAWPPEVRERRSIPRRGRPTDPQARADEPNIFVANEIFATFLSVRAPTAGGPAANPSSAHYSSTSRARLSRIHTRERALLCAMAHSAPTPRTPPLASHICSNRTQRLRSSMVSGPGCVGRVDKERSVRRFYLDLTRTCAVVARRWPRAPGLVRRARRRSSQRRQRSAAVQPADAAATVAAQAAAAEAGPRSPIAPTR